MKPLIVTTADGAKRRLNPMQIIGWKGGEFEKEPGGAVVSGTLVVLATGTVGIRESEETLDFMFEAATSPPRPRFVFGHGSVFSAGDGASYEAGSEIGPRRSPPPSKDD